MKINTISFIFFFTIGSVFFPLAGCNDKNADDDLYIDYKSLNRLDVVLVTEIAKSPDYIPGHLRDLILMDDGTMVVSDLGSVTIEQFSTEGEYIGTLAKEGRGPGELSSSFLLFEGANNSFFVRHLGTSQQMDYFERKPYEEIYTYVKSIVYEQTQDRQLTLIGSISDSTFIARVDNPMYLQRQQNVSTDYIQTPYAIVDEFKTIIVDSLHILKTPNHVVVYGEGMRFGGMPPYQYQDRLKIMKDNHYVIARPDSSALYIYNSNHERKETIYLPVNQRRVTDSDIEYHFQTRERGELRSRLENRVPKLKPPFLDIWVSEDLFLLQTDRCEKGQQMVLLDLKGKFKGSFYLSEFDEVRYLRDSKIYTLHKDPDTGHSIRIYQVNM